jgi:hypothetical protein
MPIKASISGTAFKTSNDPPGRKGANQSSHAIHSAIKAIRLADESRLKCPAMRAD